MRAVFTHVRIAIAHGVGYTKGNPIVMIYRIINRLPETDGNASFVQRSNPIESGVARPAGDDSITVVLGTKAPVLVTFGATVPALRARAGLGLGVVLPVLLQRGEL